jgi:uncharacterized membrane protein
MMCLVHMLMDHGEHGGHAMQEQQAGAPARESLPDILRRRYALGEISREQLEEMQRALGLSRTSGVSVTADEPHRHNG